MKTVKFRFNGKEVEAAEGSLVLEAARAAGVDIPHYCYHPALGNPGNCRLCVVEVEGAPKPMVSCRLPVKEGLVVRSDSEAAKRAQASSLELHLVNHPLDCPVCDQSGECGLQDYYMKFGRYESQVREDKLHKNKRLPVGSHVMLDQERCVLCTRCTRFVDEVTKTHELGIFGRGHSERVDLVPGKTLDNAYSGNVVDICPVGALTDRGFRFKVRVWYLDKTDSICPGCSRGCSISVHTSTKRPWHNDGRRVARIKPRFNAEVNGYWICDEGRYGFRPLDEDRLGRVMRLQPARPNAAPDGPRDAVAAATQPARPNAAPDGPRDAVAAATQPERRELSWEKALDELAGALKKGIGQKGAEGLAVVASGSLSNEDWASLKSLFVDALKVSRFLFSPEPDQVGQEDDLLRRREKVPNLKGGEALGFGSKIKSLSWEELEKDLADGKIWGLYMIERDVAAVLGEKAAERLSRVDIAIWQSPHKGRTGELAGYRLPATAYVEEEGHFTNFEGKVQAYQKALEPLGQAKPDWWIFEGLAERLRP